MSDAAADGAQYLLIIQLSDFHVRSDRDGCLGRAEAVVATVRPLVRRATACVLALTGDLSWSGQEGEFAAVTTFVDELRQRLTTELGSIPLSIALVPGNHDCDFSTDRPARDAVLSGNNALSQVSSDPKVLWECAQPLTNYFTFSTPLQLPPAAPPTPTPDKPTFAQTLTLVASEATNIKIVCAHTAWCSRRHEVPSTLSFPPESIPEPDSSCFTLVLLHHPLNWLEPSNAKLLRSHLEATADLVLTGHEHEPDGRKVETTSGAGAMYLEGGLFQVMPGTPATFNVIAVHSATRRYCHLTYAWDDTERGFRSPQHETILEDAASWPELPLPRKRAASQFRLQPKMVEFLNEAGLALEHPKKGRVSLSELYTVPDLRELDLVGQSEHANVLPSDKVLARLTNLYEVLITGDSQSGKTSLAKQVFKELLAQGFVPVLLSDVRKPLLGNRLEKALIAAFEEQYASPSSQAYAQLPVDRKAVVLDDMHLIGGKTSQRREWREQLRRLAGKVVYFAHEMVLPMEDLLGFEDAVFARRYRILPLGHARRAEVIERWASLEEDDERKIARVVYDTKRLVDSIIGKNFIPPYPPYVLSLVQAQSASTVVDTNAGTHGYFYELLIRCALARDSTTDEYDVTMAYLTYLAAAMMKAGTRSFTMEKLREAHAAFEQRVDVSLDFDGIRARLAKRNVLVSVDSEIGFKYPYLYYYFIALHLRDTLGSEQTRASVASFSGTLHVEESSNVLLFLAHLTKDPFVIDTLIGAARSLLSDTPPACLRPGETDIGAGLQQLERESKTFLEKDPEEARKQEFAAMDERQREAEIDADRQAAQEQSADMIRTAQVMASLQLLGQIVKNFPGTLEAARKVEIVGECYELGRRFLGWYLELVKMNNVAITTEVARLVAFMHPAFPVAKVVKRAQEIVGGLVAATAFGTVKRVSMAVGSRHLERTYRKIYQESIPIVQLIDFSLRLDHAGEFPLSDLKDIAKALQENVLPLVVLRALVMQYFDLFPLDFREKQTACSYLGVRYERRDMVVPGTKLLK